ncbi:MAG TPA: VOC family protein [Spirillospora sp.]|nr:VOC family protein [Spirillospora sp.]
MFKVTKYPRGTFSWADCTSTDTAKAKAFYSAVLGWEAEDMPLGGGLYYTMFQKDGLNVAGLGPMMPDMQAQGIPSHWNSYVNVDDIHALAGKARELGGTVMLEPMEVFDSGWMMILQDPTGAVLGVWQPKNHIGASLVNTPGAMTWNELMTPDVSAARDFFGSLFDWTFQKADGSDYYIIFNKDRMNGGIMQLNGELGNVPPNWTVYFSVADIEDTLKKVSEAGGQVLRPIQDTSVGRFAVIADPQGAVCSLIQNRQPQPWTE